ncbi:MAG: hypothetical protein ACOC5F_00690 [Candidatus Aminicenantaceae bacterium]
MKYIIKLFILIIFVGFIFYVFSAFEANAVPECNCNEHSDCDSGYLCVEPQTKGSVLHNYCILTKDGYDSHCKPCKDEGEEAYWKCQCGEGKCTYGDCSNDHCCNDGGTYNPDTGECEYCANCGDGTWDCTANDDRHCGDHDNVSNREPWYLAETDGNCTEKTNKRFYCHSNNKWYSCDDSSSWVWVDGGNLTSGDTVGSYCCDANQSGYDKWSYCGDGNLNSVCGEECDGDSDCPDDTWTNDYRCSGDKVQRKYIDYYCDGNCLCDSNEIWYNVKDCNDDDGCYDTTYRDYYCDAGSCSYTSSENDSRCLNCALSLTVDPSTINQGESSDLSWSSDDTDSCSATWTSSTATSGTETVSPSSTTTYEMDCDCVGDTGTVSNSVTVNVANTAPSADCDDNETWQYCVDSRNPKLSWTYSDPDGDSQDAYQIQIDDNSGFGSPEVDTGVINSSSKSYQLTGTDLNWNTLYYWRVKVKDDREAWSDWCSPNCDFTVPEHAYPYIDFTWSPSSVSALEAVDFIDQSTCYDDDINGSSCSSANDSFKWTIEKTTEGNPLVVYGEEVTATFSENGNWDVLLEVTDSDGFSCDDTKIIEVNFPLPEWKEVAPR